jgi:hypothetical protein
MPMPRKKLPSRGEAPWPARSEWHTNPGEAPHLPTLGSNGGGKFLDGELTNGRRDRGRLAWLYSRGVDAHGRQIGTCANLSWHRCRYALSLLRWTRPRQRGWRHWHRRTTRQRLSRPEKEGGWRRGPTHKPQRRTPPRTVRLTRGPQPSGLHGSPKRSLDGPVQWLVLLGRNERRPDHAQV